MSTPPENELVSDAVIHALAREIATLHRHTTLDFALAVGRLAVDRLYGGDLEAWRQRSGKDGSFRRLAAALEALETRGLSATMLQQAVATLDLEQRVGVTGRPQLTASHVRAVIGLPVDRQEALLGNAEAKDWTADRLEREAGKVRAKLATRPGRKPLLAFVKTVNRWERELADEKATFAGLDQVADLEAEEAARMRRAVAAMRARCDALLAALG